MAADNPPQVVAHDPQMREYVVVHFGSTPVTEAGVDVMCRQASLTEERLAQVVEEACSRDPSIRGLLEKRRLQRTKRLSEQQAGATQQQEQQQPATA